MELIVLPIIISFILSVCFTKLLLPVLRKLKFGQQVRTEGNPEHLKKQGTPTMGGAAFLLAILLCGLVFLLMEQTAYFPVLFLMLGFGIIGFLDDFLKIKKKQSEGLKAWQKMALQFLLALGFSFYLYFTVGSEVYFPFVYVRWDLGIFYIPFAFIVILGTDNGVNFTDGVDGLASSVTAVVSLLLLILSVLIDMEQTVLCGAVFGALLGFLLFNSHPAKIFMGDTGSLALGGFVAGMALQFRIGWFILIFGLVYLVEVLSVIIQVGYFKLTHGKRFFKMAPIHHHFELSGYSETQVVTLFTIVTALLSLVALLAFALI